LKKDRQDYYSDERGIYLAVTNNSALPLTNYEGIKLSVGQATYAKISRTFITHLPSPFSDCRIDVSSASSNDNPIYKRTLELNQYSVDLCYDLCLQRDFINLQCNCSDPSLAPFNVTIPVCNTTPLLNCSKNVRDQFDNVNDIDEVVLNIVLIHATNTIMNYLRAYQTIQLITILKFLKIQLNFILNSRPI
jgi:hypothetical protein